jgi:tetratricopeptide (TPR) repeat protein
MQILSNELREAVNLYDGSPSSMIWIARRTAAMWRFQDAVVVLSDALEEYPEHPELMRYRGQYLLIIREFAVADNDLTRVRAQLSAIADFIETDAPNGTVIEPASTYYFSVWFYSGLASFLQGNFELASKAFEQATKHAQNQDARITATDWHVVSLFCNRDDAKAYKLLDNLSLNVAVTDATPYLERLKVLQDMYYMPELSQYDIFGQITIKYGLAVRAKIQGNQEQYRDYLNQILDTNIWSALSYIAAEADLNRLNGSAI